MLTNNTHAALAGVTRVYPAAAGHGEVHALGPVDLTLARGEFFTVVGPSGCGKSTLLEVLAGLSPANAGNTSFEGKTVEGRVPEGVGVVFQEDASFPWLTVWDNVAFGLRRAGADPAEVERRVRDAIAFMGLKDFARAYPAQLSGGMRQRVELARAMAGDARVLLMDEPFSALDYQTRLRMRRELAELLAARPRTVVFVTHDIEEAAQLADRVVVLSARPATICEEIRIGIPRPRAVTHPQVVNTVAHVLRALGLEDATPQSQS